MSDPEHLKSLLRQAELYRTQGLLKDSRRSYLEVLEFLQRGRRFKNQEQLEETVKSRIRSVEEDQEAFDRDAEPPKLSKEVQTLIKKSFAFSRTSGGAALEAAMALAKFGQYKEALAEFKELLKKGTMALPAAKSIIRCHMALSGSDAAIDQFKKWMTREELLSAEELRYIREFLAEILNKNGVETELPGLSDRTGETEEAEGIEADILDVSAISFQVPAGPFEGRTMEFNVAFQLGNVVSVIVSAEQKALLEALGSGSLLPDMQCFSPITVFRGNGRVSGRSKIEDGPRQGDFMVDIAIDEG